jgi:predicted nucleic acid-binding protein
VIVADTGAVLALIDADDQHHSAMLRLFENDPAAWVLPWAILPEVDYLLGQHVGARVQQAFLADIAANAYSVEWGEDSDLVRAHELCAQYAGLRLGLVDSVVIAVAERLGARAIATMDLRDFAAVTIKGRPKLFPRDHAAIDSTK